MPKTKTIFNAITQQDEEAMLTVDQNGEFVATFPGGHFVKFPAVEAPEDLEAMIAEHAAANTLPEEAAALNATVETSASVVDAVATDTAPAPEPAPEA